MSIEPVPSLFVYFREQVGAAVGRRRVPTRPETQDYLANLLVTFAQGDASELLDRSIVLTLDEVLTRGAGEQLIGLQTVGDCALYIVSFFPDYLRRVQLDTSLYVNVGAFAYGRAAEIVRGTGSREPSVLLELNEKFPSIVDVLGEVAESSALGAVAKSVVQMYDRWKTTGSTRALEAMARAGAFPVGNKGGPSC